MHRFIQLAPVYDKAIVDEITSTSKDIMTLFATVSNWTTSLTYGTRADGYNKAIGGIDALELQAKSRPAPSSGIVEAVNKALEKKSVPTLIDGDAPSSTALEKISKTLLKMRDTDSKQGLTSTEVQAFKNQTSIYMDQVLTYESFLKR